MSHSQSRTYPKYKTHGVGQNRSACFHKITLGNFVPVSAPDPPDTQERTAERDPPLRDLRRRKCLLPQAMSTSKSSNFVCPFHISLRGICSFSYSIVFTREVTTVSALGSRQNRRFSTQRSTGSPSATLSSVVSGNFREHFERRRGCSRVVSVLELMLVKFQTRILLPNVRA